MLTMRIVIVLATCSVLLVLCPSHSYPQPQSNTQNQPTAQEKRGTQDSPSMIQGDRPTKTAEKPERDSKQEEEKIDIERSLAKYTGWTAGVTFLLVLVTGVLATFTYKLWKSTNKLVEGAEDTAKRQLRAYVSVTPTKLNGPANISHYFSMINHGQTPARDVMETGLMDVFPYPLPPNFPFPALPGPRHGRLVLHPDQTNYSGLAGAARTFTQQEIAHIGTGQYRLYIYGLITYTDVFEKPHITKFCHSIPRTLELIEFFNGTIPPGTPLLTESADQHNEAD
jgi:hypothetical protein